MKQLCLFLDIVKSKSGPNKKRQIAAVPIIRFSNFHKYIFVCFNRKKYISELSFITERNAVHDEV